MKRNSKVVALVLAMVLLVVVSVAGTYAYLTSKTNAVKNTFTVGNVAITLDEAKVDENGVEVVPEARVTANEYHLIPGRSYDKDPTVHVLAGSEDCWVFVQVQVTDSVDLEALLEADAVTAEVITGLDLSKWSVVSNTLDGTVRTYVFAHNAKASAGQDLVLFTGLKVPTGITGEQLDTIADLTIEVKAFAIQADGFASWTNVPATEIKFAE
jgi:predicted ribosomally synthesized peptide with SipW-like signal peptide